MSELLLPALEGTNPLGLLAALGALDALAGHVSDATLRWTDDLVPQAVLGGIGSVDDLLDMLDRDRTRWRASPVLSFPKDSPLPDAKPAGELLRRWYVAASEEPSDSPDAEMLCAIVAEGAFDRSGNAKPTHLHFTAGQQRFLEMVRTLVADVDRDRLREAICGPWAYDSPLPSLSWDARGERLYAIRATNPSSEKRLGVPGADWLAFRGLIFYPVSANGGSLRTTGCNEAWKSSAFRWPLWSVPVRRMTVRSLVADRTLVGQRARLVPQELAARGVLGVYQSPIRRSDQGGYGSFGAAAALETGPDFVAVKA